MSDRTYMQLTILECARKDAAQVLALLKEAGFADEDDKVLKLGEQYTVEEAGLGTLADELARELAPLCSFEGWEDPKYEFPGVRVTSLLADPEASRLHTGQCFSDGKPVVLVASLKAASKSGDQKALEALLDLVREDAVDDALKALSAVPMTVAPYAYVIVERQHGPSLAVRYPDDAAAQWALESSFFIDSLCQEDCLDAYVSDHVDQALRDDPLGLEEVVPPGDDSSIDASAVPASLAGWEAEGVDRV